jgi:predicted lysophospholipase L1 biosynthesis ABC-type transport system permease subunit
VAAGTVATLAGFSARVGDGVGASLSAFGPNLTVRPQVGGPERIPHAEVARVRAVPGVQTAAGAVDEVALASTGAAQQTRQEQMGFDRIEVRADPARVAEVALAIAAAVPGVEAAPLLRASVSDARLTRRLTLLLAAVSGVSLLLALLSVGAATTALMGERRTEIGLFLALGDSGRRVGLFFAAELLAAALLAGVAGQVVGELAARGLAERLLGAGAAGGAFTWSGFLAAAAAAVLVVGTAVLVALRRVGRLDPAQVLRGE